MGWGMYYNKNYSLFKITNGLEDIFYLPSEIDESSLDLFLLNLVKGGILIVRSYFM